jgi:hypothetical protein
LYTVPVVGLTVSLFTRLAMLEDPVHKTKWMKYSLKRGDAVTVVGAVRNASRSCVMSKGVPSIALPDSVGNCNTSALGGTLPCRRPGHCSVW